PTRRHLPVQRQLETVVLILGNNVATFFTGPGIEHKDAIFDLPLIRNSLSLEFAPAVRCLTVEEQFPARSLLFPGEHVRLRVLQFGSFAVIGRNESGTGAVSYREQHRAQADSGKDPTLEQHGYSPPIVESKKE